jgi:anti-anti-sigma regulatory factor
LKKVGGKFSLAGVKGTVADVLKIVHFDRLFKLFGSVDEAAKAFQ